MTPDIKVPNEQPPELVYYDRGDHYVATVVRVKGWFGSIRYAWSVSIYSGSDLLTAYKTRCGRDRSKAEAIANCLHWTHGALTNGRIQTSAYFTDLD